MRYRFGDLVPEPIRENKVWRLAERHGHSQCFYSGVECYFYARRDKKRQYPRAATREHLIPRNRCPFLDDDAAKNVVLCSSIMNNLLGDAPLSVKLEVRDQMRGLGRRSNPALEQATREVLDHYRYKNRFPWQMASFEDPEERQQAEHYMSLMTLMDLRLFRLLTP